MGTPLPPNEPRDTCPLCFGAGGIIGGVQPRWVWLDFIGILPGPRAGEQTGPWPTGKWLLEYQDGCHYRVQWPHHYIELVWGASSTTIQWVDQSSTLLFNSGILTGACEVEVESQIGLGLTTIAYGGICRITWSSKGL